jgi:peptidoglycan/xylan/chitin deacetylase (PgdA/CDA1 family)
MTASNIFRSSAPRWARLKYDRPVGLTRREILAGLGASAIGGLGVLSAEQAYAEAQRTAPLPFYGGFASGVRPDLSPPSAPAGTVVWSGRTDQRRVALTFDDGPMPNWTPRVLATLARHDVPATFFLKGINVLRHGAIHQRSIGLHELGNHTWDHPDLARLEYRECSDQLARTSSIIERVYGARPTLFRPPYGHLAGSSFLAAAEQDLTTVLWNSQMHESRFTDKPAGIVASVRRAARPGSIILGHDTGPSNRLVTIENLDAIITALKADGFAFTTVSELCGLR